MVIREDTINFVVPDLGPINQIKVFSAMQKFKKQINDLEPNAIINITCSGNAFRADVSLSATNVSEEVMRPIQEEVMRKFNGF